ncbi:MAG: hypothetical protein ABW101_02385 [Candidatus Thiodiazotropha sp.]
MINNSEYNTSDSEAASVRKGHTILWFCSSIGIISLLLQVISIFGFDFDLLEFFNWVLLPSPILHFALLFIISFLSYFALHGHRWAQWTFSIILFLVGISYLISSLANSIIELNSIELDARYLLENIIHFLLSLVQLTVSSLLVFSESVLDYSDYLVGWHVEENWNKYFKANKSSCRSFDHKLIYSNLNRRKTIGRLVPKITLALIFSGLIMFIDYINRMTEIIHVKIWNDPMPTNDWAAVGTIIGKSITEIYEVIELLFSGYLIIFVFPTLIVLPWLVPLAFSWKKPIRFLLLRPFNRSWITRELESVIKRELVPIGHCYTLADLSIRIPIFIRIPIIYGQLSMFHFRLRKICRPKHISRLINEMNRHTMRNLNWYLSRNKLFPIACSNRGWRTCVSRIVQEVDVVIMDISKITENITWEIELLKDLGTIKRTIFLVRESDRIKSEKLLYKLLGYDCQNPIVLSYSTSGASHFGVIQTAAVNLLCS